MTKSAFDLFGLDPIFDLDLAQLEKSYFAAQRQFHPDRLIGKPDAVRQQAISQSMLINDAYQTLKNPLKRAQHLLALQHISVGDEKDAVKPQMAILEEIMELRELVTQMATHTNITTLNEEVVKRMDKLMQALSRAFSQKDLQNAAQMTIRLGYLLKIQDEIRIHRKRLEV
jgi:molecular chaperone HscB